MRKSRFFVPRELILAAAIPYVVSLVVMYVGGEGKILSFVANPQDVLVARIDSGTLDTQTRILQRDLNKAYADYKTSTFRAYYRQLKNHGEAERVLSSRKEVPAVVIATPRWLTIALQRAAPNKLSSIVTTQSEVKNVIGTRRKLLELSIITGTPVFGLPREPTKQSLQFLKLVLSGLSAESPMRESFLLGSIGVEAHWSSAAHLAVAKFYLGNLYLQQALSEDNGARNNVECALSFYGSGANAIRPGDNRDLKASILNNLAVATLVRAALEGNKRLRFKAIGFFKQALQAEKEPNLYQVDSEVFQTVRSNMKRVGGRKKTWKYGVKHKGNKGYRKGTKEK